MAPDSPGPADLSFTQFIAILLGCWGDFFRKVEPECRGIVLDLQLNELAPLLLPGAELALVVLRIYAGPEGARIRASNRAAPGHTSSLTFTVLVPDLSELSPARLQQLSVRHSTGSTMCESNRQRPEGRRLLLPHHLQLIQTLPGASGAA